MTWDVTGLSFDSKSFTPTASGTLDLQGFALRPDGSTLFVLNEAGSWPIVDQHTLGTNFDISTAGASIGSGALTNHSNTFPGTLWFKPDGTKLFTINNNISTNNTEVWEVPLGTPWLISTLNVGAVVIFDTNTLIGDFGTAGHMSQDGFHLYMQESNSGGFDARTIHQYDLGTAWDISSAVSAAKSFDPVAQISGSQNIYIGNTGATMLLNTVAGVLFQYNLITPYDISTAVYASKTYNLASDVAVIANTSDLWTDPCSTKFYALGNTGGIGERTVYQWDMGATTCLPSVLDNIFQVALEVIEDINPINSNTLKLCYPFDNTVGESFTLDESPSNHPTNLNTGGGFTEAQGQFKLEIGTTGSITSVKVSIIELLGSAVAFNTNLSITTADLATEINANTTAGLGHGYSASATLQRIIITAPLNSGISENNKFLTYTSTGDIILTGDAYWENTVLLLHGNGVDQSTTIIDSSASGVGSPHSMTAQNGAELDTGIVQYGTASILLSGAAATMTSPEIEDYVSSPDSADWHFGSSAGTIESWIYPTNLALNELQVIASQYNANTSNRSWRFFLGGGAGSQVLNFASHLDGGVTNTTTITGNFKFSNNEWFHVAIDWDDSMLARLYVNGIVVSSAVTLEASFFNSTTILRIGKWLSGGGASDFHGYFGGRIDDFRITKGTARYEGRNFVPPCGQLDIATTMDAVCMGGYLLGTSNPFINSTINQFGGGALDISGTNFTRTLLPQPDFNFLADFTIEFWVYRNALTDGTVMGQWPSTADKGWKVNFLGGNLEFEHTLDGSAVLTKSAAVVVPAATWTHLAFENFGTIFTIYVDGVAKLSAPSVTPIHASIVDLIIGKKEEAPPNSFDGLIDELKIVVGKATFKQPFVKPIASTDCVSIITPPVVNWIPGNLGEQDECSDSEFTIKIIGLETVLGTQTLQATGLPAGMVIDNFGNVIGVLPIHTAPPTVMEYFFQVTLYDNSVPILGPDTFSFDVRDQYLNDILQVTVPALYEPDDRTLWKQHLFALIPNDNIYRATDPAFGITLTPDLFIIDGLTEDDLTAFVTALSREDGRGPAKHDVIVKTLSFGTTTLADVLFYTIEDTGSDILSFPNPLGPQGTAKNPITISPDPIEPISIDNVRDQLISAVGFDSQFNQERIPDFLGGTYQPVLIAAFVSKGSGQALVDKFNADAVHHVFKGRVISFDRINLKRCSTVWDENGGSSILVKFDDI